MKRILHLTTHLNIGGISSYLLSLCRGLKSLGYECHVASCGGELEEAFQKEGVILHKIPLYTKSEFSPKILLSCLKLKKIYPGYRWDIVHAHTRVTQVTGYFLSRALPIKFMTTFHGFYDHHLGRKILPCLGSHTIANSFSVERDLKENYPKFKNTISTVLHGIDTEWFCARHIETLPKEDFKKMYGLSNLPTIGIVGRLAKEKGHLNLIEITRLLKEEYRLLVQLLIVGDGKYDDQIEKKVKMFGLQKQVRSVPAQKDPRVALSLMDIYVTHHDGPEGFGLSTLEAMAMAKPVIISYTQGGMEDFILQGQDGFLLHKASHHDMARAIQYLLTSPEVRKNVGQRAALKVKQNFSHLRMAQNTHALYEKLLT